MKVSLLNPVPLQFRENGEIFSENPQKENELSFGELLRSKITETNALQKEADRLTEAFAAGKPVELDKMMIAMEKADIALQLTVQIRNKLVEAYKEISRMQI